MTTEETPAKFDRELLNELARGAQKVFENAEALFFEAKILSAAGALKRLLDTLAYGAVIVLCLDYRDWDARFSIKDIVGEFSLLLVAAGNVSADGDRAGRERHLASDLGYLIPSRPFNRGRDKEIADVALAESLFI
jgi:hypothetical protein